MKKIVLTLILVSFFAGGYAQSSANRTAKTKVADALALMPAPDAAEYGRLMNDLVSTGNEGVDMLTEMFTGTNDVAVNYALSGWSAYVTKPGNEAARELFVNGILRAMARSNDPEIKAFYIRLLQQAGGVDSVKSLAQYIDDPQLGKPALAALTSINTIEVRTAIAEAVRNGRGDKVALAQAVGDTWVSGAVESTLLSWLKEDDPALKREVYYALGRTGSITSLPVLRFAAENAGYTGEPTEATTQYISLMQQLTGDGYRKEMLAESRKLIKAAAKKNATNTRIAAFGIYLSIMGEEGMPFVLEAMNDGDRRYRVGVLEMTRPLASRAFYTALLDKMGKVKNNEAKVDMLTFVGQSGDAYFTDRILPIVGNPNDELNTAAIWAVTKLGGNAVPPALVGELKKEGSSPTVVEAAKSGLLSYKGYVNNEAAFAVEQGADAGKIAALSVLAGRHAVEKADVVIEATKSANPRVAMAAFEALAKVVSQDDLPTLYLMLDTVSSYKTAMVQQAVVAALSTLPQAQSIEAVTSQMNKAGDKKPFYYVILAGMGAPQALPVIAEGYARGNESEKAQAFTALLAWNGLEAADYLYAIAKSDDRFKDNALKGYVFRVSTSGITPERKLLMLSDAMDIARTPEQQQLILKEADKLKTFQALMFAGKYLDSPDAGVKQQAALTVMNIALANKDFYGPAVTGLLDKVLAVITGPDSGYQKENIRKHLAGLPSGGYVSIFNGRDLSGWKGLVENPIKRAKMTPAELAQKQVTADEAMRRDWVVEDGMLVFIGKGYDNICTEKQYGDFEMYLDWKLYAEGKDADAGVYLRGTPQVQMWDTARRNVGAEVGSGGLYNNKVHPSKPSKVADNRLGEWNTFYIRMVGDRVTVVLNGEKVVDNVILENYWDRNLPIFPMEQIELQAHGTRVAYRNLYINELPMEEPFRLSAEEQKEGYEILFDGTNMHQWTGNTQDYTAENGTITLYPTNGGGGNLYTKKEFDDFVFRFEFMLSPGANNGLGIRTPMEGDAAYVGMELQILDNDAPVYSRLEPYQYHGSVYGVIAAKREALKPTGEWNYQEVFVKGNHIRITLNGTVILDGDIAEAAKNGTIDGKQHPGLFNKSGHIAFLGHGSVVKFRNIRVKSLK